MDTLQSIFVHAPIDGFDAAKYTLEYDKLSVMDRWLLSKLNTLIKEVDGNLENYRILLILHMPKNNHILIRRFIKNQRRNRKQRVEPPTGLIDRKCGGSFRCA